MDGCFKISAMYNSWDEISVILSRQGIQLHPDKIRFGNHCTVSLHNKITPASKHKSLLRALEVHEATCAVNHSNPCQFNVGLPNNLNVVLIIKSQCEVCVNLKLQIIHLNRQYCHSDYTDQAISTANELHVYQVHYLHIGLHVGYMYAQAMHSDI